MYCSTETKVQLSLRYLCVLLYKLRPHIWLSRYCNIYALFSTNLLRSTVEHQDVSKQVFRVHTVLLTEYSEYSFRLVPVDNIIYVNNDRCFHIAVRGYCDSNLNHYRNTRSHKYFSQPNSSFSALMTYVRST